MWVPAGTMRRLDGGIEMDARRFSAFNLIATFVGCLALVGSLLLTAVKPADAVTYGDNMVLPSSTAPWVVPIYWGKINKKSQQICTGSLIAQQFVLTAAHCLDGLENGTFSVQVGGDRLGTGTRIYVDGWWMNGRYSRKRYINDVAVLHLVQPANIGQLAALPTSKRAPGKMRIYGWGCRASDFVAGRLCQS